MVIVHQPLAAAELKRARQDPYHVARRATKQHGDTPQGDEDDPTRNDAARRQRFEWFMRAFSVAQRLLFESPSFASLARRAAEIDEVYDCGGEGSAVLDSFFVSHVLSDWTQGFANESPASVSAFVLRHLGAPAELVSHAEALATSRLHVVWCDALEESADGSEVARMRCPATGRHWRVEVAKPFFRTGLGYLARIIDAPDGKIIMATPYALLSSEAEWREYFVRQLGTPEKVPAGDKGGASRGKDKRARKKTKRAPTRAGDSPAQRLDRHMKRAPWPEYWIDFVVEAFVGRVDGCPALVGVPDLPETIPGHPEFDEEAKRPWAELLDDEDGLDFRIADLPLSLRIHTAGRMVAGEPPSPDDPPLVRLRRLLSEQVKAEKLHEEAAEDCERVCRTLGADTLVLDHPGLYQLLAAYTFFGLPGQRLKSALERLLDSGRLDDEERALAEVHRGARFSLFEIVTVIPDEGLEVYDLLQKRGLRIRERLFTRQAFVGMTLAAWLIEGQGPPTLEGALYPVPSDMGRAVLERLRSLRPAERRLAPTVVALIDSLSNSSDEIQVAQMSLFPEL